MFSSVKDVLINVGCRASFIVEQAVHSLRAVNWQWVAAATGSGLHTVGTSSYFFQGWFTAYQLEQGCFSPPPVGKKNNVEEAEVELSYA